MHKYIIILLILINTAFNQECLGGELRSIESYVYGRFEVNMKSVNGDGYVSSFFTSHDFWETFYGNWATFINEIDVEFTGNMDNSIQCTTHHPGNWSSTQIIPLSFNPHNGYHNYAFEWTPYYVKWFVDDVEIYSQSEGTVNDLVYPQKIMMNLWSSIYTDWVGQWENETMPVYTYYDFEQPPDDWIENCIEKKIII